MATQARILGSSMTCDHDEEDRECDGLVDTNSGRARQIHEMLGAAFVLFQALSLLRFIVQCV